MKIIRHGIEHKKEYKLKEKRRLKCNNCHCVFIATKDDIYTSFNLLSKLTYFVDCPDCKTSIFYQKKECD